MTNDPNENRHVRRRGSGVIVFLTVCAGPLVALGFWCVEVFVLRKESCATADRRLEELGFYLSVGFVVGLVVALAAAVYVFVRRRLAVPNESSDENL